MPVVIIKQGGYFMNYMDKNLTVGELIVQLPASEKVLKKYQVDYCCGGNRKLWAVISELELDPKEFYLELEAARKEEQNTYKDLNFTEMEPLVLSDYINDRHHSYLRRSLPEIGELLLTIVRVHGVNHPELYELYKQFGKLRTDLEQHLLKEEIMLFPAFEVEVENQDEIRRLSAVIISEHEAAGEILTIMRKITDDYNLPDDACATFERTYNLLEELEQDLHQHIHLENNILLREYDARSNN